VYAWPHLARIVQSRDAALAAEIAKAAGITLEPSPGPGGTAPPALAPALVDSVVCAAADVLGAPPADVRPALRAALLRARELGLTADTIEQALAQPLPAARQRETAKAKASGTRRAKQA
jgi:hypothetical protein